MELQFIWNVEMAYIEIIIIAIYIRKLTNLYRIILISKRGIAYVWNLNIKN